MFHILIVNPKSVALLTSNMNRVMLNDKHANEISNLPPLDGAADIASDSVINTEEGIISLLPLDELSNGNTDDSDDDVSSCSSFRSMLASFTTSIISSVAAGATSLL